MLFRSAFAVLVLHHAPKPLIAVREMARIVKPGGQVIVLDLCAHGQEWLRSEQADLWLGFTNEEVDALLAQPSLERGSRRVVSKVSSSRGGEPLELFVAWATKTQ